MAKPSLKRRKWGWLVWIVILVGGGFGVRTWARRRPRETTTVRVHRVERGSVRDLVTTSAAGRLAARREATIRAEIAGNIVRLHHRRGELVRAGEPMVSYDTNDLQNRVRAAQAATVLTRAQTAQAQASAELARVNVARARTLRDRGVTPSAEVETLERQLEIAERSVNTARSGLATGGANVRLALDALRRAVVHAPFDGVVINTSVEEGEVTAPGSPLFQIADTAELHIDGELDEADLGRVEVGMVSEISFDAFPTVRFRGRLTEIAPSVSRDLRGNRSIAIHVTVDPDRRLRVGMSADVDIVVATRENVLWVPPNAVLGRGANRAVMVADNGVARRRPIEVGIATYEAVEVRSGVREGERVILTTSSADLPDGAAITVRRDENIRAPATGAAR